MSATTAILIVNGFDRSGRWGPFHEAEAIKYPWIELCLGQVLKHSAGEDYEILVYDGSGLESHREVLRSHSLVTVLPHVQPVGPVLSHPAALDALVAATDPRTTYLITLDTDAFPVRDGWMSQLIGYLDGGAGLAGIYRDEMQECLRPFVHPSCLCIRRTELMGLESSFCRQFAQDTGQNITLDLQQAGRGIVGLHRSNARNFHFLIAGVYGDLVYHHGAGSRHAGFWTSTDVVADERVRTVLREEAFRDIDHLIECLRGKSDDDFGLGG